MVVPRTPSYPPSILKNEHPPLLGKRDALRGGS